MSINSFLFELLAIGVCSTSQPLHGLERSWNPGEGVLAVSGITLLAVYFLAVAVLGHQPRERGRQAKADREQRWRELWERTSGEVDKVVAEYHARFRRHLAGSIGVVYARYSTRHQDSIADQVRTIAACQDGAEILQQPDPERIEQFRSREQKLKRSIEFNQRDPGETEEDQAETASLIRQLRREWNEVLCEITSIEKIRERKVVIPNEDEVRSVIDEIGRILTAAADEKEEENVATAREIIDLLTGGRIDLYQKGERARKCGWLQGRFRIDLVSVLTVKLSGVRPSESHPGIEVVVDYKRELLVEQQEVVAMRLYEEGKLGKEIAADMGVHSSYVCKLLDRGFAKRGLKRPDGRLRRASLTNKQVKTPLYKQIASEAARLAEAGCVS